MCVVHGFFSICKRCELFTIVNVEMMYIASFYGRGKSLGDIDNK